MKTWSRKQWYEWLHFQMREVNGALDEEKRTTLDGKLWEMSDRLHKEISCILTEAH